MVEGCRVESSRSVKGGSGDTDGMESAGKLDERLLSASSTIELTPGREITGGVGSRVASGSKLEIMSPTSELGAPTPANPEAMPFISCAIASLLVVLD